MCELRKLLDKTITTTTTRNYFANKDIKENKKQRQTDMNLKARNLLNIQMLIIEIIMTSTQRNQFVIILNGDVNITGCVYRRSVTRCSNVQNTKLLCVVLFFLFSCRFVQLKL